MRLAKGGWKVPARIVFRAEDDRWYAIIDGREFEPHRDPQYAPHVADIWQGGGEIIDQAEYDWLVAVKQHAIDHGWEDHPSLNPRTPIHPMRLRPIPWSPQRSA